MKWNKLGKIFDPTKYKLPNECVEFAQAPQTLIFDTFVRIYFSTRQRDINGKFLSHIAFVDFDIDLKNIINISTNTIIELGKLGCYDEHGIFPFNIYKDNDRILGYIGGWTRRVSVSVDTSIGLAISNDNGLSFNRIGDGPILTSSLNEPFLIGDPFVAKFNNVYYMWYIYGIRWVQSIKDNIPERVYKIGYAISNNGINWQKRNNTQIITNKLNLDECQALPSVIMHNGLYHMIFCYRQATDFRKNRDRSYRLGYAFSDDLIHWTRNDNEVGINVSENDWDSDMLCYPHIFHYNKKIYLLYNGNEFGRYGFGLAVLEK
jgi:predicted GH43/DUF377 family glycosyl hydrolase